MRKKPQILFEDNDLLVVNKNAGFPTLPDRHDKSSPNLLNYLGKYFGKLYVVHRLDRDTTGAMCFAKNPVTHRSLSEAFMKRRVAKKYLALTMGEFDEMEGLIEAPIEKLNNKNKVSIAKGGKKALTHYHVLAKWPGYTLAELDIKTGRTHQIRVHLRHIGHPLLVDSKYGGLTKFMLSTLIRNYKGKTKERPLLHRTPLHSHVLSIPSSDGDLSTFKAPLPKDMKAVIFQLDKHLGRR